MDKTCLGYGTDNHNTSVGSINKNGKKRSISFDKLCGISLAHPPKTPPSRKKIEVYLVRVKIRDETAMRLRFCVEQRQKRKTSVFILVFSQFLVFLLNFKIYVHAVKSQIYSRRKTTLHEQLFS